MKSLPKNKKVFSYGSFVYHYDLIRQERKSLSLTVTPSLGILVKCPYAADDQRVEIFLRKKWFWLEKQLAFFGKYQRKLYKKEYVSGESFYYLGRQYQLIVKRGKLDKVLLTRGKLVVETTSKVRDGKYTKKLLDSWYKEKMDRVFSEQLSLMLKKFQYDFVPEIVTKSMDKRWGSALSSKKIVLNHKLIQASKECIDYVLVHELCHFTYRNHSADFWKLLDKKSPHWQKAKEKLELKHG